VAGGFNTASRPQYIAIPPSFDNTLTNLLARIEIPKSSRPSADSRFPNEFLDVAQGLVLPVIEWLDTKTLACRIEIKDFDGNNVIPSIPDERLTQNVTFFFKANV